MEIKKPTVSIGLPVHNGAHNLRQALDSLLAQDYTNIEIIISDNASTDETQKICLEYADRHARIRYYRHEEIIWATGNYNHVFNLSLSDYFMWASHNMYWDKQFISSCMKQFDENEDLVLVGAVTKSIGMESSQLLLVDQGISTIGLQAFRRFANYKIYLHNGTCVNGIFYGIYKRNILCRIMPMRKLIANDHLLLASLSFEGEFLTINKPLLHKRQGGMSASLRSIASGECIKNEILIKYPYIVRELFLQRMIFKTDKIHVVYKIALSFWSFIYYVIYFLLRPSINVSRRALSQMFPVWIKERIRSIIGLLII